MSRPSFRAKADPGPKTASDLEQAAVEQVVYWFQVRGALSLIRIWPHGGTYEQFAQLDLLPQVKTVLKSHTRWAL